MVKDQVLEVLRNAKDQYCSGESIANTLGVSRNAIWKSIQALRKDGYEILSSTNRGYCLMKEGDQLDAGQILSTLQKSHPSLEAPSISIYSCLSSTNQEAIRLANEGAQSGTIVLADMQEHGRGHHAHAFHSPSGGIYMSVLLRPETLHLPSADLPLLTAFAAVCVAESIQEQTGFSTSIKWVNDLFLQDRKVCGILTEVGSDFESGDISYLVIGIGINFSTKSEDFHPSLRDLATSLYPSGEPAVTRNQLIASILGRLLPKEMETPLFLRAPLLASYRQRLYEKNQVVTVVARDGSQFQGTLVDVDDSCKAIVKKEDGTMSTLSFGHYKLLHNMSNKRS